MAAAKVFDEGRHIIGFVGTERYAATRLAAVEDRKRCLPLSCPGGARENGIDCKPVAVLHQHVGHEAQPTLATVGLAIEPGIGIGGRGMRLVRALFLVEVAFSVASRPGWLARV